LDFWTSLAAFLNIGFFPTLLARLTGANASILIFCCLLYLGTSPLQTAGIMATYLIFIQLVKYTQGNRLSLRNFRIFRGWKLWTALAVSVLALFVYPFGALVLFLLIFLLELVNRITLSIPAQDRMPANRRLVYTCVAALLMTAGLTATAFIPPDVYLYLGGIAAIAICIFFWWAGNDRTRLANVWDYVALAMFLPAGLFGFDCTDWIIDLRRKGMSNMLARNLPVIVIPAFFIGMLASNLLFDQFPVSGIVIVVFATICIRLFGYYQVSGRGRANLVALVVTVLAVFCLFLTTPHLTGVQNAFDSMMSNTPVSLDAIKNLF
jgi:hypothetical protein